MGIGHLGWGGGGGGGDTLSEIARESSFSEALIQKKERYSAKPADKVIIFAASRQ